MQIVKDNYSKLVKYFNQETRHIKPIAVIAGRLKIQSGQLVLIFVSILVTLMILDAMTHTMVTLLGIIYPVFLTVKAIRNEDSEQKQKMLSFWLVFGFLTAIDRPLYFLIGWIPFYYSIKLVFYILLIYPKTNYAEKFYDRIIKPLADRLMKGR